MKNSPSKSLSPMPAGLLARMTVLTILAAGIPVNDADAKNPIPFCGRDHHMPDKPPFLHGKKAEGEVICVVDGDTFDVRLNNGELVRARLWGVDCAESNFNSKCMRNGKENCRKEIGEGESAKEKVRQMLGDGKVTLEPPYKNNGNRLLAYVRLRNGVDFSRQLISSCLCKEEYSHKRKQDYRRAAERCNK